MSSQATGQIPAFQGSRLSQALAAEVKSAAELARELGVPEKTIGRWRHAGIQPRPANVRRLAAALNREPSWFYEPEREAA